MMVQVQVASDGWSSRWSVPSSLLEACLIPECMRINNPDLLLRNPATTPRRTTPCSIPILFPSKRARAQAFLSDFSFANHAHGLPPGAERRAWRWLWPNAYGCTVFQTMLGRSASQDHSDTLHAACCILYTVYCIHLHLHPTPICTSRMQKWHLSIHHGTLYISRFACHYELKAGFPEPYPVVYVVTIAPQADVVPWGNHVEFSLGGFSRHWLADML